MIRLSTGKSDRAKQEVLDSKNKVLSSERKSSPNRRIRQYFAIPSTATVLRDSEIAANSSCPSVTESQVLGNMMEVCRLD